MGGVWLMPTFTPILEIKKPLGNEINNRAAYNENLDIIDKNVALLTDFSMAKTIGYTVTPTFDSQGRVTQMDIKTAAAVLVKRQSLVYGANYIDETNTYYSEGNPVFSRTVRHNLDANGNYSGSVVTA
jgi:hypothetical protein